MVNVIEKCIIIAEMTIKFYKFQNFKLRANNITCEWSRMLIQPIMKYLNNKNYLNFV